MRNIATKSVSDLPTDFDWQAFREPRTTDELIGWGHTEAEAIRDLRAQEDGANVRVLPIALKIARQ
jgi:hypothetical protein